MGKKKQKKLNKAKNINKKMQNQNKTTKLLNESFIKKLYYFPKTTPCTPSSKTYTW